MRFLLDSSVAVRWFMDHLGIPWLTADARMVRRLRGDPRIRAL
jgi:hypothetical protein